MAGMRMLIITGNPEVAESVSIAIELHWSAARVITAQTGREGIGMAGTGNPDVVILDLELPDVRGSEVIRSIRSFSFAPVIALAVKGEEAKALECGAVDYMLKPCGPVEFYRKVEARIRDRDRFAGAQPHSHGDIVVEPQNLRLRHGGRVTELTPLETGLMSCLIRGGGSVVTYNRLIEAAWDSDFAGASDSLRLHVVRLREKVETDLVHPQVILTVPAEGYFLAPPRWSLYHAATPQAPSWQRVSRT